MHISGLYYKAQPCSDEFKHVTEHIDGFPHITGQIGYFKECTYTMH